MIKLFSNIVIWYYSNLISLSMKRLSSEPSLACTHFWLLTFECFGPFWCTLFSFFGLCPLCMTYGLRLKMNCGNKLLGFFGIQLDVNGLCQLSVGPFVSLGNFVSKSIFMFSFPSMEKINIFNNGSINPFKLDFFFVIGVV